MKEYLQTAWNWLRSRQKATLAAGAVIGAVMDDPLITIISSML